MDGFVAWTLASSAQVKRAGALTPELFGDCGWIPFTYSAHDAVVKAIIDAQISPQCATHPTTWYVLQITLSKEQFLNAFKSGLVKHVTSPAMGWRWYDEMELSNVSCQWMRMTIAPIGLGEWADKTLNTKAWASNGCCRGCGKEDLPTWRAGKQLCCYEFCAQCWNNFCVEMDEKAQVELAVAKVEVELAVEVEMAVEVELAVEVEHDQAIVSEY